MRNSTVGNGLLEIYLREIRQAVERDGELTEAEIARLKFGGKPNSLSHDLERLRLRLLENPEDLDPAGLRARQKAEALAHLDRELQTVGRQMNVCEEREEHNQQTALAASMLPSMSVLDKILRYQTALERQMFRSMNQLERFQRMRHGETIPAPLTMEVSERP